MSEHDHLPTVIASDGFLVTTRCRECGAIQLTNERQLDRERSLRWQIADLLGQYARARLWWATQGDLS